MYLRSIGLLGITLSLLVCVFAQHKNVIHYCKEVTGDPDSVQILVNIVKNTDAINKVYMFDATTLDTTTYVNRVETAECIKDATADPIVYDFTITVTDPTTFPCGATVYDDNGVTVVAMLFRVYAYSDIMLDADDDAYVLRCRMDDLNELQISNTAVEFSPGKIITIQQPQVGVHLRILDSVDMVPLHITSLGQNAILSIECLSEQSLGPDNFGTHFFIGFLGNSAVSGTTPGELFIVITPRYSFPTDISVTTALDGVNQVDYSIDDGTSKVLIFPEDYMGCADGGVSDIADIGIEINSDHMEISVLVCNFNTGSADCYSALPTDTTGTEYWTSSMMSANTNSEFMIIAHEDNTAITVDVPTASGHTSAGTSVSFTLNKLEAYHFAVTTSVADTSHINGYHVTSDKDISVISGNLHYSEDHTVTQLAPVEKYGKHYVLVAVDFVDDGRLTKYIIQALTPGVTTTVTQYLPDTTTQDYSITTTTYPPQVIEVIKGAQCEILADNPIMVTQIVEPKLGSGFGPSMLVMPSVEQWAPSYTFNFAYGSGYTVTVLTVLRSDSDLTQYRVNGFATSPQLEDPIAGPTAFTFTKGMSLSADIGQYTIGLEDTTTTMMVLCYVSSGATIADSDIGVSFVPFGMRYADFGFCQKVGRAGDGVDNDCDGILDEEAKNNLDDDGDGLIDEDTLAFDSGIAGAVAVRPINCKVSGDPTFPVASTIYITGADGCAVTGAGAFKAATDLAPYVGPNEKMKILRSGAFKLGMFIGPPRVYFMCDIEQYCTDSSDVACTTICSTTLRKKREVADGYPTNITTDVWVFPYSGDQGNSHTNGTYRPARLSDCMDNTYIQVMLSFLSALTLMALFTSICFCCLLRRKNNREKDKRRRRFMEMFRKKSF